MSRFDTEILKAMTLDAQLKCQCMCHELKAQKKRKNFKCILCNCEVNIKSTKDKDYGKRN